MFFIEKEKKRKKKKKKENLYVHAKTQMHKVGAYHIIKDPSALSV